MARPKRKDKTRTVLRTGELQRSDGSYQYSWTDENHKRKLMIRKGAILRTHEKLETSLRTGTVFHVSFFIC